MMKSMIAAGAAALFLAPGLAFATTMGPASTPLTALGGASLIQQVSQHCSCGGKCYKYDYYRRCIDYRCYVCKKKYY